MKDSKRGIINPNPEKRPLQPCHEVWRAEVGMGRGKRKVAHVWLHEFIPVQLFLFVTSMVGLDSSSSTGLG